MPSRSEIAEGLRALALAAGDAILARYAAPAAGPAFRTKADASPVTDADLASSKVILAGLPAVVPGVPVVCEETELSEQPTEVGPSFVLVDPLDGTKEYISRNGDFTVNIALVARGAPVLGVVYAPARRRLFVGFRDEGGVGRAFEQREGGAPRPIRVRGPRRRREPVAS
jgi:3'-phosphoadenosine 5'-phosphosulfate (PAPS) 3'-phosphatase